MDIKPPVRKAHCEPYSKPPGEGKDQKQKTEDREGTKGDSKKINDFLKDIHLNNMLQNQV